MCGILLHNAHLLPQHSLCSIQPTPTPPSPCLSLSPRPWLLYTHLHAISAAGVLLYNTRRNVLGRAFIVLNFVCGYGNANSSDGARVRGTSVCVVDRVNATCGAAASRLFACLWECCDIKHLAPIRFCLPLYLLHDTRTHVLMSDSHHSSSGSAESFNKVRE